MIRLRFRLQDRAFGIAALISIVTSLISFAAWVTHVIVCIKAAEWGFLIAGDVALPVGVVHGIGVWFGAW